MPEPDGAVRGLVGLADLCELMACALAFPRDGSLAVALVGGTFLADARACLADAGAPDQAAATVASLFAPYADRDAAELADALRKGHSILFLSPGGTTPVWPYEAAFKYVAAGRGGVPSLFRSPVAIDVEAMMARAGNAPAAGLGEPADSVWGEFSHLAFLYGSMATALAQGSADGYRGFREFADAFCGAHFGTWVPAFMEQVQAEAATGLHSFGSEYADIAAFGALVASMVVSDCNR